MGAINNLREAVFLDELPAPLYEAVVDLWQKGRIEKLEMRKRFCLDCGVRWRSGRIDRGQVEGVAV